MRKTYFIIAFLLLGLLVNRGQSASPAAPSDDFSEFDEFDEPEIKIDPVGLDETAGNLKPQPPPVDEFNEESPQKQQQPEIRNDSPNDEDEEATVEEELQPEEDELPVKKEIERKPFEPIKLSSLPLHLRNNWSSYYIEIGIVAAIVLYFINFFAGSSTNQKLAENFWNASFELLQSHFTLVGDDGSKELDPKRTYVKDSDSNFVLWCTGRFGYDCCIIELNLNKRQDLLSTLWSLIKPSADQITVKIFLKDDAMDSFVFCLANKKGGFKTVKEYNDVVTFCNPKKTIEKYAFLNDNFVLLNEIGDVTSLVFDNQLLGLLASSPELINFIHISDQFSGPKPGEQDAQPTKAPAVKRVLTLSFNCPKGIGSSYEMEQMKELVSMSLSLAERVKRYKLKKDMKAKAVTNRRKMEEHYEKLSNAEKQQAAQQKKEEKRRLEKEKYIDANDEFRLRKFEEKQYKKDMKKKFKPKMKAIRAN